MPMERVEMPDGTARFIPKCKICDNAPRARLIEADWSAGRTAAAIAKEMTAGGWAITGATVTKHMAHVPGGRERKNVPMPHMDGADFVKGRLLDAIIAKERRLRQEAEEHGEEFDGEFILDKDMQPALNTVLKAEGIKIKRDDAQSKRQISLFMLMLGKTGGLAPAGLIGDGSIEGQYREVTDEDREAVRNAPKGKMLEGIVETMNPYMRVKDEDGEDEDGEE